MLQKSLIIILSLVYHSSAATFVTKTATIEPREGNPLPRYVNTELGSINSMGLPNLGFEYYLDYLLKLQKENSNKALFFSVTGTKAEDIHAVLHKINNSEFNGLTELNLSCPNVVGKPQIAYDLETTTKLLTEVVSYYKEAFQVDKERIYPVGLPVLDYYFDEERKKKARERFYSYFSELKNKKLLLYTPTFRKTLEENHALLKKISFSHLKESLGDEWAILIRLHPTMITRGIIEKLPKGVYDMSTYQDIKDLYEVSDVLVNDYSSTVVEYSLLKKPVILFALDLEEYDRGFYRDFKETVPGNIVMDLESLVREIKEEKTDNEKLNYFLSLHYDYFDSNNSNRILEIIRNG